MYPPNLYLLHHLNILRSHLARAIQVKMPQLLTSSILALTFVTCYLRSLQHTMLPQRRPAHEYVQHDPSIFAVSLDQYSSSHRLLVQENLRIYARISTKADDPQTRERLQELTAHAKLSANTAIPTHEDAAPDEPDDETSC